MSFFAQPMQAVHMARVATLSDISSVQQFSYIAFDTTSVVRAGGVIGSRGGGEVPAHSFACRDAMACLSPLGNSQ